jgi:hypothetical protein
VNIYEDHWQEIVLIIADMLPSADHLVLYIKARVDEILAEDVYIQQFLGWTHLKAVSMEVAYKPAAMRAMYSGFPLEWVICGHLASLLSRTLDSSQKGGSLDEVFLREPMLTLDSTLRYALLMANYASNGEYGITWALQALLQGILKHHPELREELKYWQPVIEAVPRESEREVEVWRQWWNVSGELAIAQLKMTMLRHRNIGQSWDFTEEQIVRLQKYYRGNILLARCLKSKNLNLHIRQEVEETLMLPISEIEKRRHEKVD